MPLPSHPGPATGRAATLRRAIALASAAAAVLLLVLGQPSPGLAVGGPAAPVGAVARSVAADVAADVAAKDVDVVGTVDCGLPSGRRCSLGDALVLWTTDVTGTYEAVRIDIGWIRGKLPALDQDDEITLSVELLPDGTLRALSVISARRREGTVNQGLSTASRAVAESRRDRGEQQDRDPTVVRAATGAVRGVVLNALTNAPVSGATVRLLGTVAAATSDGAGAFVLASVEDPGSYQLEASAPLFASQAVPVLVASGGVTQVTVLLQPLPGVLSGLVRSVQDGTPIPNATVQVAGFSAATNAGGGFAIGGIPPGAYQATATAPGRIGQALPVTIAGGATAQLTFDLATAFPNLTFTLVWGPQPADLDAHLSGPASGGGRFHAYFLVPNPETYAGVTADAQAGFGPEQIIVRQDPVTQQYVAGSYHFWVDNPNVGVGPNYDGSQARVIVNRDGLLLGVFDVAAAAGDPNLRLWHVANVQLDAAGNATIQPVQQFTAGDSFVVLAPPYGPKPPRR